MLMHLIPKIVNGYADVDTALVDIHVPELDLTLREGKEVMVKKPYPNKTHHVVCRKVGRKAINGIFIRTDMAIDKFSVVTRWLINAERVVKHVVNYTLLDNDYNCISDDPLNWSRTREGEFECRAPQHLKPYTPLESTVCMQVLFEGDSTFKKYGFRDTFEDGMLVIREEELRLHTIRYERLLHWQEMSGRLPVIGDSFLIASKVIRCA